MITNPYKVLGVPDGASLDECTRAYKKLAKKYHPDLNPNDKAAEIKMAEINAAYDQIKNGTAFHQGYRAQARQSAASADSYLNSAAQFIKSGQYTQAINLLNSIEDRDSRWYYLSALANMALGNRSVAEDHIRTAYAKEPDNDAYRQAYESITNGINPLNYNPFSSFFDFSDIYDNDNTGGYYSESNSENRRTYTYRGGCLGRILRIIFIIMVIRLILRFVFTVGSGFNAKRSYTPPASSYSQEYGESGNNSGNYFGESNSPAESA